MSGAWWRRTVVIVAVAVAVPVVATGTAAGDDADTAKPDLKVAVRSPSGTCGPYADDLPVLVARSNVAPGGTVADVGICVTNRGRPARVDLFVRELVDLDVACSPDEASVDATCGSNGRGELSPALAQGVGVSASCSPQPAVDEGSVRALPSLSAAPVRIADRLRNRDVVCVRLLLRFAPAADDLGRVQSDRTTWRYLLAADDR
ncbi:MAG TPA: hypothetical protein VM143_00660 [Acidimicrobiales bacterium]|nr:hypothetical protein [Acidimicrobiales bacterium]